MIERVLLIVNSASGTGVRPSLPAELMRELRESLGRVPELELAAVDEHAAARRAVAAFLAVSEARAAVVAAGGGGTLRAAVEGVMDTEAACRAVVGALRMGSGNVLARQLGVASDPHLAIRQLGAAIRAQTTSRRSAIRCRFGTASGADEIRHAVVMCGLGQWGRTSGDLARWHRRFPRSRTAVADVAGLERLNHIEYVAAAAARLAEAAIRPASCERVEIAHAETLERYRLLAGAVMTTRVGGIPFDPHVSPGQAAAGVLLLPRAGRPRRFRLEAGRPVRIRLLDRGFAEFFLDEDTEIAHRELLLEVTDTVSFLEVTA